MRPLASWSAFQISRQTVLNDPAGYARIVAVQWYGMWTWSWISTRPAAEKALAAVSEPDLSKFLAGKNKVKLSGLIIVPHSVFLFKMTISAMMLALSAILPFIAITRRFDNHVLTVAAAAGITIPA